MVNKLLIPGCLAIIFLAGCRKDAATQLTALNNSNLSAAEQGVGSTGKQFVDTAGTWYASYNGNAGTYPTFTDKDIISNGVARAPYINKDFYYSGISYNIPSKYTIPGDSITFEAKVKNTNDPYGEYNVVLQLYGERHTAEVQFVARQSRLPFTQYYIGSDICKSISELVHYFDHFETVRLIMKNGTTAVYLDSVLLYTFQYSPANSIGRLKTIGVSFRGYGVCTNINVRNSFNRKLIFTEGFNIDGQTHVVYYHQ